MADEKKIVITSNAWLTEEALVSLNKLGRVVTLSDDSQETLLLELPDTNTIIIGPRPYITRELLESANSLQQVARVGVGLDSIDIPAATECGVMVTNTPEVTSDSVAEFSVSLLLSLAKNIPRCDRAVKGGHWDDRNDLLFDHVELKGKTHGIVGMGRIGRKVATRCQAFGMKIIYYKRTREIEFEEKNAVTYAPFKDLVRESDSISLHLPLSTETLNLFAEPEFRAMKKTAFLINQARGKVVNETELVKALKKGWIGGYATDVYEQEPPDPGCELLAFKNVIATPHLAGSTRESRARSANMVVEDVARVLRGDSPLHPTNPEVLK
jgi:D-3-phosphoglycerate dehydrogenase